MKHLRIFALVVYNNYLPRNWSERTMDADLRFVIDALAAMAED